MPHVEHHGGLGRFVIVDCRGQGDVEAGSVRPIARILEQASDAGTIAELLRQ